MPKTNTSSHSFFRTHFKNGMPIAPTNEILYIQGDNTAYSNVITKNLGAYRKIFSQAGFRLFYLPEFINNCVSEGLYSYYFPDINETPPSFDIREVYHQLWGTFFHKKPFPAGDTFLFFASDDSIYGYEIKELDTNVIIYKVFRFVDIISEAQGDELFSMFPGIGLLDYPDDEIADRGFRYQIDILSAEIQERVEKLRVYGVSEAAIKALFQKEQELSRLVITDDYRIVLPDYNGMEVKLEPLPRAVYFLYLRHPEGLMFKELPCHRDEFMQIYVRLTNRKNDDITARSIDRVLDPTDNSINEKCSRIREAFISRFDDNLAKEYYITSYYGLKKRISIDRSLVDLGPVNNI